MIRAPRAIAFDPTPIEDAMPSEGDTMPSEEVEITTTPPRPSDLCGESACLRA